jgi:hypothetical protein
LRQRIKNLGNGSPSFDLFIVTHVDRDHIEGAVKLLGDRQLGVTFGDVWFNGWQQIVAADQLGPLQGEYLSTLLRRGKHHWNQAFDGGPVALKESGIPRRIPLPGGMTLTLLAPTLEGLRGLRPVWKQTLREEGLAPGDARTARRLARDRALRPADFLGSPRLDVRILARTSSPPDTSVANGSIAVLARFKKKVCLLAGDAPAPVLAESVRRLLGGRERLQVDAFKLAHHGSKGSTDEDLIRLLSCSRYLFSTDGSYYGHPDPEAVARVIVHGRGAGQPTLYFNYRSKQSGSWDKPRLQRDPEYSFSATYPGSGEEGLTVVL